MKRATLFFFCLFLASVPLWLANRSALNSLLIATAVWLLVVAHETTVLVSGRSHPVSIRRLGVEGLLLALIVAWVVAQISSWTPRAWHHPIWNLASEALNQEIPGAITSSPFLSMLALLRLMTSAAVFWLALQLGRNPARARTLLWWIGVSGFCYASYDVATAFLSPKFYQGNGGAMAGAWIAPGFVASDASAAYAALPLLALIGLVLRHFDFGQSRSSVRMFVSRSIKLLDGIPGLLSMAAISILAAIFLTDSRVGITAALVGVAAILILTGVRDQRWRRPMVPVFWVAMLSGAAILYVLLGPFDTGTPLPEAGATRSGVFLSYWRSLFDSSLLGSGYGTIEHYLPMHNSATVTPLVAASTLLSVFEGLGLLSGIGLLLLAVLLVGRCALAVGRGSRAAAPLVATAASVAVGLHSLAAASLESQAVTLTWMALLGLGVAQSWSRSDASSS